MTIPSGFHAWAQMAGVSPYHTETWSTEAMTAFRGWKLSRARTKWRWLRDQGHIALVIAQGGRWDLLREVRRDFEEALAAPPSRVYRGACPCHPLRLGSGGKTEDPWIGMARENPWIWDGATPAELAGAWLEAQR